VIGKKAAIAYNHPKRHMLRHFLFPSLGNRLPGSKADGVNQAGYSE